MICKEVRKIDIIQQPYSSSGKASGSLGGIPEAGWTPTTQHTVLRLAVTGSVDSKGTIKPPPQAAIKRDVCKTEERACDAVLVSIVTRAVIGSQHPKGFQGSGDYGRDVIGSGEQLGAFQASSRRGKSLQKDSPSGRSARDSEELASSVVLITPTTVYILRGQGKRELLCDASPAPPCADCEASRLQHSTLRLRLTTSATRIGTFPFIDSIPYHTAPAVLRRSTLLLMSTSFR